MTTAHVACSARRDYAPHGAAMLRSVLTATPELAIEVHFLHGPDLPRRSRGKLRRTVEEAGGMLVLHEVPPERIAGLPGGRGIAPTAWYRLLLPELLAGVDAVLYLDVDVIAVRSVAPLLSTDLDGACIAAVDNVWEEWNAGWPAQLGLPAEQGYFNSGVALMHLARIREEGRDRAMLDFVRDHLDRIKWLDQDVLNVVLGDERVPLHPRWNAMNSVMAFPQAAGVFGAEAVAEARERPAIRHFEGPGASKPWHLLCPWEDRRLYLEHQRASAFGRGIPAGLTPANLARRALRP